MAGLALDLGASIALRGGDHRLGDISPHHGGALDLGIILVRSRTPVGICRNRWLDCPRCVQLFASFSIGLISRSMRQKKYSVLCPKFWDRKKKPIIRIEDISK